MYIPEELLKMSGKELDKVLVPKLFENKYMFYGDDSPIKNIFKIIGKYPGGVVLKDTPASSPIQKTNKGIINYFKPLTKEKLNSLIIENAYNVVETFTQEQFIDYYYNKAVSVFGEELVSKGDEDITIYFPEVLIKNSVEQSLVLKDIYVLLKFLGGRLTEQWMTRTTASEKELRNGYLFSHLSRSMLGNFHNQICYGSDTPIRRVLDICRNSSKNTFKNINTFFFLLKEFLTWESLEGTPYNYIDSVITDAKKFIDVSLYPSIDFRECFDILKNHLSSLTYTYQIMDGKYTIKLSQESIDTIDNILSSNMSEENLYYRLGNRSVALNPTFETDYYYNKYNNQKSNVIFKEETVIMKVDQTDEDVVAALSWKIHVNSLKVVIGAIESKLETYILNKKLTENV